MIARTLRRKRSITVLRDQQPEAPKTTRQLSGSILVNEDDRSHAWVSLQCEERDYHELWQARGQHHDAKLPFGERIGMMLYPSKEDPDGLLG